MWCRLHEDRCIDLLGPGDRWCGPPPSVRLAARLRKDRSLDGAGCLYETRLPLPLSPFAATIENDNYRANIVAFALELDAIFGLYEKGTRVTVHGEGEEAS